MNGILIIDKPKNYTSRDVVNVVSKVYGTKKVGHTGTLDPLATGVLVICLGSYTKLVNILTSQEKEYIMTIQFGIETDTLDITGNVLRNNDIFPTKEEILNTLPNFIGKMEQEVPIYSAKKVNGKKLYEYARNGEVVELPKQKIEIFELELLDYQDDSAVIRARVSKGTYIRSFICDFCETLHVLGTMKELQRTKQGNFDIINTFSLDKIQEEKVPLLSFNSFLSYKKYELKEEEYKKVIHGNTLKIEEDTNYILLTYQGEEVALYQKVNEFYKPLLQSV